MPTIQDVFANPKFDSLSPDAQAIAVGTVYPQFQSLSPEAQPIALKSLRDKYSQPGIQRPKLPAGLSDLKPREGPPTLADVGTKSLPYLKGFAKDIGRSAYGLAESAGPLVLPLKKEQRDKVQGFLAPSNQQEKVGGYVGEAAQLAAGAYGLMGDLSKGAQVASELASKLGDLHPVAKILAKFAARRVPGVGTINDVSDLVSALKKQFGEGLTGVPKEVTKPLSVRLWEETHGKPPANATEEVQAIRELREGSRVRPRAKETLKPKDVSTPAASSQPGASTGAEKPVGAAGPQATPAKGDAATYVHDPKVDIGKTSRQLNLGAVASAQANVKNQTMAARFLGKTRQEIIGMDEAEYKTHLKIVNAERRAKGLSQFEPPRPGVNRRTFKELLVDIADDADELRGKTPAPKPEKAPEPPKKDFEF